MSSSLSFCPVCATCLVERELGGHRRPVCPRQECGFVFWNNPIPVAAAIVEHQGELILARNASWPEGLFGLITGFVEPREDPADAVVREVGEELNLVATISEFVGVYNFARANQILLVYHVIGEGEIVLEEELAAYRRVEKSRVEYGPGGTGLGLRDWLVSQGYSPRPAALPPAVRAWLAGDR